MAADYVVGSAGGQLGNLEAGALSSLTTPVISALAGGLVTVAGAAVIGLALPGFAGYRRPPDRAGGQALTGPAPASAETWQDAVVATHVALLRGVNVGGVKVAMSDLRAIVAGLGHDGVSTYIQSGNVLFTTGRTDTAGLAAEMEQAIEAALAIRPRVLVLSRAELGQAVLNNPYPQEQNPRALHAVFLAADPAPDRREAVAAAQQAAAGKGSRDTARYVGSVLYLHTPDGFGRSELAARLSRGRGPLAPGEAATARNWATVTKLLALCGG